MKLIEKLARVAALLKFPKRKNFGSVAEAFPRMVFEEAFEAGFRKAREMAAAIQEDCHTADGCCSIVIKELGEEEVEE